MPPDTLADPAQFDRLAYESPERLPALNTPLGTVRAGYLAFLRADVDGMRAALDSLEGVNAPPATGIRLMLRVVLGDEAEIAAMVLEPEGGSPLAWESTCHAASAIGVACAMTGNLERAQMHLMVARTLAQGLHLTNRTQMLTLEWGRIASLRGVPDPDAIARQLQSPMPPRRRNWGQRTLAEAHMAQGSYSQALWALGTPEADTSADAALRDFLHALMRFPPVESADPGLDYTRLAAAVRRAATPDAAADLAGIVGMPQAGYAAVVEGMAFARTAPLAQQTARLLSRQTFAPADLAVYRLVALLGAVANGAALHGSALAGRELPMTEQLAQQTARLRSPDEVFGHVLNFNPENFVLLAFSPVAAQVPGLGLASVPLLAGKHIIYGGRQHTLPGRWGQSTILKALGVPRDDLPRSDRQRYLKAIGEFSRPPVNLGWVARGCLRLSASSARLGHANESVLWREAYAAVTEALSGDVRETLRRYPPVIQ